MLINESRWIGNHIQEIITLESLPVLNIGSSTEHYRKVTQPYVQENIFAKFKDEKNEVIHLDMKAAEGVGLVGDLYDEDFLKSVKKLKIKSVLCNNTLMYLDGHSRKKLAETLYEIVPSGGFLIISNSHIYPAAPDPKEEYYRASASEMYEDLFSKFKLIAAENVEDNLTHLADLQRQSKILLLKRMVAFCLITAPKYKAADWQFMKEYYTKNYNKNYSAACLFLQKY